MNRKCKKESAEGRPHIGICTLQIGSFSPNTATKFLGRRQPCRGILSCLVKKSLVLECFAVLNGRFFFTAATGDRVNTGCIPRETGAGGEEKNHSKPCKSLCESAQAGSFLYACAQSRQSMIVPMGRGGKRSDVQWPSLRGAVRDGGRSMIAPTGAEVDWRTPNGRPYGMRWGRKLQVR